MTTSSYDGLPPIQHGPLGAPVHEAGPPVQAFVESADDSWRPLPQPPVETPQPPVDMPPTPLGAPPPPAEPPVSTPQPPHGAPPPLAEPPIQQPSSDFGGMSSESTQSWTPSDAFGGPSDIGSAPSFPATTENGLPRRIAPSSVVPGHDLVLPPTAHPEQTVPQPPMGPPSMDSSMGASSMDSSMGQPLTSQPLTPQPLSQSPSPQSPLSQPPLSQPPLSQPPLSQQSLSQPPLSQPPLEPTDEAVAERTMATWLSDSPASPPQTYEAPPPTQGYGAMAFPPNGQGRNETAILPEMPTGRQPGGWQPGGWQPSPHGAFAPGGGPGGPGDLGPPQRSSGPSKPLLITVVGLVVVALVAVGVVLWPNGDKKQDSAASGQSPAAANTPASTKANSVGRQEAIVMNKILNASAASRSGLARALAAGKTCRGLPTAIAGFQQVATQRRSQMAHARAAKVGHLANGTRLRQSLTRSIQYSLAADQLLLTWARGKQGCHGRPKPDANYRRAGGPLSAQASAAKAQFATLWAPVARQYHLPARTANGF
ncbi:MAG TPA: hypothetical protein VH912_00695 [Streptosporangiaceae bacterium]